MKYKSIITAFAIVFSLLLTSCGNDHKVPEIIDNKITEEDADTKFENNNLDIDSRYINNIGEVTEIPKTSLDKYTYSSLSNEEKDIYNKIYLAVANYEPVVKFEREISFKMFQKIYALIYLQEIRLFWMSGRYDIYDGTKNEINLNYIISRQAAEEAVKKINDKAVSVNKMISTENKTDIDKALIIHDYIISNVQYSKNGGDSAQSIYGSFLDGFAQSQGYSKLFSFLCDTVGIDNIIIMGMTETGKRHSWNMIRLDDQWYNIDLVMDDKDTIILHNYFNVKDSEIINKTHFQDLTYFTPPECSDDKYNYFKYYGLYADTYKEAYNIFERQLLKNTAENKSDVFVKLADKKEYTKTKRHLKDENGFFDIIKEVNKKSGEKIRETAVTPKFDDDMLIIGFMINYQ